MAEKTTFSDMVANENRVTLPERCCGKCIHGRDIRDPGQAGRVMVMCKALPPTPMLMIDARTRQSLVQAHWPILDQAEPGCDLFAPRPDGEQNPGS